MLDAFIKEFHVGEKVKPEMYSPLVLAYLGDCVYELFVRTHLIADANLPVKRLHRSACELVKAHSQAELYHRICDMLTEEEDAIYRRGRNTDSRPPKNADMQDYKSATGVETLIGYLYLKGKHERIIELLTKLLEK